jgi:general secretion pathway protein A
VYEEFFNLSDAPFRLTPDPHFLYLSPKHAEALAHLRLGLTEPGGFVCITGEIGTGKTTVLRTFLADLGSDVPTAFIFNPTLSWENMLRRIARDLGVAVDEVADADLMDVLNERLLAIRRDDRAAVVVIDEAQAIAPEVLERLRLLSNLETTTEKLLKLILVGQPQLGRVLADPALAQLNQRITLRWHLRPLTRAETFAYVRHRLTVAGGPRAARLFTRPALWRLHRYARGVPRLVNMIAHRALLAAYVRRQHRVRARTVRRAYREIRTVPLTQRTRAWRPLWWATMVAIVLVVAATRVPEVRRRLAMVSTPTVSAPSPAVADPIPAARPDAGDHPVVAMTTSTTPPARRPRSDRALAAFERHLADLGPERSLRSAVETVLARWHAPALRDDETPSADSLEPVAHRRRLESMTLRGNLSMLRLLDLPAILELHLASARAPTYAALTAVDDEVVTLTAGEEMAWLTFRDLDRVWLGDAHVLWRDYEGLGPTFGTEAHGDNVARLQRLLARIGYYDGPATGRFGETTEVAVRRFQRSRRLDDDARVGRLTRITLYAAVGGYGAPTLTAEATGPTTAAQQADGHGGAS